MELTCQEGGCSACSADAPNRKDLLLDLDSLQSQVENLTERLAIMGQNDKAAEIDRLLTRIDGLDSRIDHLVRERATLSRNLESLSRLAQRLKKLLKVERYADIESAVRLLAAAVA